MIRPPIAQSSWGGSHPPRHPHLWATPRAPPRPHVAARAARAGGTLRLLGQGYTPVSSCAPEVPGASETPGVIFCSSPLGLCGTEGMEFSYGTSSRLASISSSTTLETEGRCVLLWREWAEIPAKWSWDITPSMGWAQGVSLHPKFL